MKNDVQIRCTRMKMKLPKLLVIVVTTLVLSGCIPAGIKQNISKISSRNEEQASTVIAYIDGTEVPYTAITDEVEIIYTDIGFEPSQLSLKPGTLVTFINHSSVRMWIKSEQPFWSLDPSFDQGEGITLGHVYSFVFMKAGEWKFVNFLNKDHSGLIEVVGE